MTIDPKDQVTVSLPVAGVLTPAEIEQSAISALEEKVQGSAFEFHNRVQITLNRILGIADVSDFQRTGWLTVIEDLHDLSQVCTRIAVAISTSLAARDALIHQNTSRAPESALEPDA